MSRPEQPSPDLGMLTEQGAARWLEMPLQRLQRMRRAGTGPAYIKTGRIIRYRRSTLDRWLAERERKRRET